ncbi:MAG TPA: hypothetical protein VE033_08790 [Acetobacteraceae bacterium]|jgi:CheY-like chemotaxis protein|nr:hypothetical protein [Acetobacteraceae bacterium]
MRAGSQLRVLLVENDDTVADLLETELAAWGCHVVSTSLDHRALVLALHRPFDAVVVSLGLGGSGAGALLNCLAMTAPGSSLVALHADDVAPAARLPLGDVLLVRRPHGPEEVSTAAIEIVAAAAQATVAR